MFFRLMQSGVWPVVRDDPRLQTDPRLHKLLIYMALSGVSGVSGIFYNRALCACVRARVRMCAWLYFTPDTPDTPDTSIKINGLRCPGSKIWKCYTPDTPDRSWTLAKIWLCARVWHEHHSEAKRMQRMQASAREAEEGGFRGPGQVRLGAWSYQ